AAVVPRRVGLLRLTGRPMAPCSPPGMRAMRAHLLARGVPSGETALRGTSRPIPAPRSRAPRPPWQNDSGSLALDTARRQPHPCRRAAMASSIRGERGHVAALHIDRPTCATLTHGVGSRVWGADLLPRR